MTCFHPKIAWQRTSWTLDTTHENSVTKKFSKYNDLLQPLLPNKEEYIEQKRKFQSKISFSYIPNARQIEIPCHKCIGCILDKANQWATRLMLEAQNWKYAWFVTFTYDENNRRKDKALNNEDMTDFWKRLRYHYNGEEKLQYKDKVEKPIRYFYCGERGEKNKREHFHAIIFNIKFDDLKFYKFNKQGDPLYTSKKLKKIWGKGFCPIGRCDYKSACYVARYTQKKIGQQEKIYYYKDIFDKKKGKMVTKRLNKNKNEEFILMSRKIGIGRLYWEKFRNKIIKNENILLAIKDKDGHYVTKAKAIPPYFMKLLNKENFEAYEKIKYHKQQQADDYKNKIIELESFNGNKEEKWKQHLKKIENILLDKAKLLKRNNFI